LKPARKDAVTWLAGGPGDAATEQALAQGWQSSALRTNRDTLLVDQRGTGGSDPPHGANVTQYGTRTAMDDLDVVRAALGYRQLDVYGGSYGATAAQVYAKLHPSSVRTLILSGASALDVPFFARFAANAQRALDQLAQFCALQARCRNAFPHWERQFGELVKAWNARPVHGMSGDELVSVVHKMLRDVNTAVSIPLVVSRAAKGDYAPLEHAGSGDLDIGDLNVMGASIWCSEPWVGLDARGSWGTDFDTYATAHIAAFRNACSHVPRRAEPRSLWRLPASSRVPVLALVGGADPQDPVTNLLDLKRHFPDSRPVVLPHQGHDFGWGGACDAVLANFVELGTTKGLDTTPCVGEVVVPPFQLTD
jgi:pimeloyl-ACP methyl ester carboxylesterase